MLQQNLRSRTQPWSNLNKTLLHAIYLEQITVRYNLRDELIKHGERQDDGPINHERVIAGCAWLFSLAQLISLY